MRTRIPGGARPGWILLLAGGALLAGGCTTGGPPPRPEPVVSPTGIVYEPGVPPEETRFSQTATLYLQDERPERALDFALQGVQDDPGNPIHYFLAGTAYARLERYQQADSMFSRAVEIYPAYELDVEPERESAWAVAFNAGVQAYNRGDVEDAIEAWRGASTIFDLRPEASRNLASLLAGEARYDEAIEVYQAALRGLGKVPATRVLSPDEVAKRRELGDRTAESLIQLLMYRERFAEAEPLLRARLEDAPGDVGLRSDLARALDGQGRSGEAAEIYASLLSERSLESVQLFNLGVALFRSSDFARAEEAFQRLTEMQPASRDAWFNYANTLFAAERWETLVRAGTRLLELDPLGEKAALITARAHLEAGDEEAALAGVRRSDAAPVHVEQLQMRPSESGTTVQGRILGNAAEPGTPVRLRFTFYGESGPLGTETVTLEAPASGEAAELEVPFGRRAAWYRYEVVEG